MTEDKKQVDPSDLDYASKALSEGYFAGLDIVDARLRMHFFNESLDNTVFIDLNSPTLIESSWSNCSSWSLSKYSCELLKALSFCVSEEISELNLEEDGMSLEFEFGTLDFVFTDQELWSREYNWAITYGTEFSWTDGTPGIASIHPLGIVRL